MTEGTGDVAGDAELAYWRDLAEQRGQVIRALHEFNYWHESTVARGEVVAGLEESVTIWRERALAAEARLAAASSAEGGAAALARRGARAVRRAVRSRMVRG
jgi:hypothetical protein